MQDKTRSDKAKQELTGTAPADRHKTQLHHRTQAWCCVLHHQEGRQGGEIEAKLPGASRETTRRQIVCARAGVVANYLIWILVVLDTSVRTLFTCFRVGNTGKGEQPPFFSR